MLRMLRPLPRRVRVRAYVCEYRRAAIPRPPHRPPAHPRLSVSVDATSILVASKRSAAPRAAPARPRARALTGVTLAPASLLSQNPSVFASLQNPAPPRANVAAAGCRKGSEGSGKRGASNPTPSAQKMGMYWEMRPFWSCEMHSAIQTMLRISCSLSLR